MMTPGWMRHLRRSSRSGWKGWDDRAERRPDICDARGQVRSGAVGAPHCCGSRLVSAIYATTPRSSGDTRRSGPALSLQRIRRAVVVEGKRPPQEVSS